MIREEEITVDYNKLVFFRKKKSSEEFSLIIHDEIVTTAFEIFFQDRYLAYDEYLELIRVQLDHRGISCPLDLLIDLLSPVKDLYPFSIRKMEDVFKILIMLGYLDPEEKVIGIIMEEYRRIVKKRSLGKWKMAYKMRVMNDNQDFETKEEAVNMLDRFEPKWDYQRKIRHIQNYFAIPNLSSELNRIQTLRYYRNIGLEEIDNKIGYNPGSMEGFMERLKKNDIEISENSIMDIARMIYKLKNVSTYFEKKRNELIHEKLIEHLGRRPDNAFELEKAAYQLDIDRRDALRVGYLYSEIDKISDISLAIQKCDLIISLLNRVPIDDDELLSCASSLGFMIHGSDMDQIRELLKIRKEPKDRVFEFFRDENNVFSYLSVPFLDDDLIEGLKIWLDFINISSKNERRKLLKNRNIPDHILEEVS